MGKFNCMYIACMFKVLVCFNFSEEIKNLKSQLELRTTREAQLINAQRQGIFICCANSCTYMCSETAKVCK